LLAACRDYIAADARRTITFEYVMLHGINDSPAQARELVKLLRGLPVKMNLIPFNPFAQSPYQCSPLEVIDQFRNILLNSGIMTITRKTRGGDISAACGQLAGKVLNRKSRNSLFIHQEY
jgi:23S rRNA (adenine2503-C2)-methyltransferase